MPKWRQLVQQRTCRLQQPALEPRAPRPRRKRDGRRGLAAGDGVPVRPGRHPCLSSHQDLHRPGKRLRGELRPRFGRQEAAPTSRTEMAGMLRGDRHSGRSTHRGARAPLPIRKAAVCRLRLSVGVALTITPILPRCKMASAAPSGQMPQEGEPCQELRHSTDHVFTSPGISPSPSRSPERFPASCTPEGLSSNIHRDSGQTWTKRGRCEVVNEVWRMRRTSSAGGFVTLS